MCSYLFWGILLTLYAFIYFSDKNIWSMAKRRVEQELRLVPGNALYEVWSRPMELRFACYMFNVTNPDEVMKGENPSFKEYGPFVYKQIVEKQVWEMNEVEDEILYTTKSTFIYDKYASIDPSKHEKVIVLNAGYIGTISMLSTLPPDFMKKYGDNIPKLFPDRNSIFLKARPTDILFSGVKVTCNLKKFPELDLICKTMKASPPPGLKSTEKEDVFLLSLFSKENDTIGGPFTVQRGVKNISRLGDITSYKGKRVQSLWNSDSCNTVKGTDNFPSAPLIKPLPFISTFIPTYCRDMQTDYLDEVSILGLTGSRFVLTESSWYENATQCYCPKVKGQIQCLPKGLLDVSECQRIPVIVSEPHFLHGDPELLTYARGLHPDEQLHQTYIVIEPLTGTPLAGQKKTQVNLKLSKQPVQLLSKVSEGYFPLAWCENEKKISLKDVVDTYQAIRVLRLAKYFDMLPLVFGPYFILISIFLCNCTKRRVKPNVLIAESLLLTNSRSRNDARRSPPPQRVAFQANSLSL